MLKQILFTVALGCVSLSSFAANTIVEMKTSQGNIEIELFNTDMLIFTPEDGVHIHELLKDNVF